MQSALKRHTIFQKHSNVKQVCGRLSIQHEINNLIDDENYVEERNALHDKLIQHMNDTRDLYRGYQWRMRPWRKDFVPNWENEGYTRQRENEEYEPRQLDYDTGLPMKEAVRKKC